MIALLLVAQLSAEIGRAPTFTDLLHPKAGAVEAYRADPDVPGGLVRIKPMGACLGAGRLEASLAEPAALYRKGDRPAKGLKRWADYPDPKACLLGAAP